MSWPHHIWQGWLLIGILVWFVPVVAYFFDRGSRAMTNHPDPIAYLHSLRRTSAMGAAFVGVCVLCGAGGLTTDDMRLRCPNPRGVTSDQAVLDALTEEQSDE